PLSGVRGVAASRVARDARRACAAARRRRRTVRGLQSPSPPDHPTDLAGYRTRGIRGERAGARSARPAPLRAFPRSQAPGVARLSAGGQPVGVGAIFGDLLKGCYGLFAWELWRWGVGRNLHFLWLA